MPRTDRQIVAAAFRGQFTKPVRDLSDAYVRRLAREVREARAEGRRPDRQAGRGHRPRVISGQRVTTEHPKAYVRRAGGIVRPGDATPAPIRVSAADRHVAGHGVLVNRDFRSGYAAWRFLRSLGDDAPVQGIARGLLVPEYADIDVVEDEETGVEGVRRWRVFYTGTGAGTPDENGATVTTYADWRATLDRVFIPGTCDRFVVRWQG